MFFKNKAFTAHFDVKLLLKKIPLNYCKVCWCVRRWFLPPLSMPRSVCYYRMLQYMISI